jgi:DNA-binding HxlR family transcriptional regulator
VTRTDFTRMRCPVARSMAVLGERWAILVLREAFYGTRHFDAFERHLGIAPNILSARLRSLVEHGLLERVPRVGSDGTGGGGRHEYRLTPKGRDFFPAYLALKRWSDRWMADPAGPAVVLVDRATGEEVTAPVPRGPDGTPLGPEDVRVLPGPSASPGMRRRLTAAAAPEPGEAEDVAR